MMTTTHRISLITLVFTFAVCILLSLTPSAAIQVWSATGEVSQQQKAGQSLGPTDPAEFEAFLDTYLANR